MYLVRLGSFNGKGDNWERMTDSIPQGGLHNDTHFAKLYTAGRPTVIRFVGTPKSNHCNRSPRCLLGLSMKMMVYGYY